MKKIILIGSGFMAREYLKILSNLSVEVIIVGRGAQKLELLKADYPDFKYYSGGLESYLINHKEVPEFAINCASIGQLRGTTELLLQHGAKNILLEKPGDLTKEGLLAMQQLAITEDARIVVGYNRRFYTSFTTLKQEADVDGGITSVHFEFTEWIHTINPKLYSKESLTKWIISNSSHVIDTVFALIGLPASIHSSILGQNEISWHPSGSLFTGSGVSIKGIPFTYHSNWMAPGRWSIEVLTNKRRFYLKPMEKLFVQKIGSVQVTELVLDDQVDINFKAGLMRQTKAFLNKSDQNFVTLEEQIQATKIYDQIGGY